MNRMEAIYWACRILPDADDYHRAYIARELRMGELNVYSPRGYIDGDAMNDAGYLRYLSYSDDGRRPLVDLSKTRLTYVEIISRAQTAVRVPNLPITLTDLRVIDPMGVEFAGGLPANLEYLEIRSVGRAPARLPNLPPGLRYCCVPYALWRKLPDIPVGCTRGWVPQAYRYTRPNIPW